MAGAEKKGLHQCDPFISVQHFNVRFHDRSDAIGKHLDIRYIRIQQRWRRPEECPLECPESFELDGGEGEIRTLGRAFDPTTV
jgi:hypothetical protein